ncbi:MAG: DNA primase [Legionella sp.]
MTGLIPRTFIDELLNRTDIVELIDSYVPLKKRGSAYLCCCPFHNEKTPSFNVVEKKQYYHCFGCGASGNAISFVMNHLHLSFVDAIEQLAARLNITVPREGRTAMNSNPSLNLYSLLQKIAEYYQDNLRISGNPAIDYLKNRHVNSKVARLYQLGYAPLGWQNLENTFKQHAEELLTTGMVIKKNDNATYDRYRQRLMFPIHDRQGRIVGFGGRTLDQTQKPKYLNSPETILFQKNRELYGLFQAIQHQNPIDAIIIVEGYLDVIALAQYGINNAVATMGTATSNYHIQLLGKYTKRLIFCFDGDNAGRQAAWRALESCLTHLNSDLEAYFCFLPEEHDPDSLVRSQGKDTFLSYVYNAKALSDYFFTALSTDLDLTSISGKSQLVHKTKNHLQKLSDSPYKQLMIAELARLTRIESHRLQQLIEDKSPAEQSIHHQSIARSPIRIAIALLLQHPQIYQRCKQRIQINTFDNRKHHILITIMEYLEHNADANTASLIELWRDTPLFQSITKLAAWNHQVPEQALDNEFCDTVLFLQRQDAENKIQKLLEKSRNQGLTEMERIQLQTMLKNRHH